MNVKKAIAFVQDQGNLIEQARLEYIFSGKRPSQKVVARLFAGQRPDGGWAAFWATDYSSLDATCFRLAQAEQLGRNKEEPAIRRVLSFISQHQRADGSWEESDQVADVAPPWAKPGNLPAKLYLTANCGLWLALLDRNLEQAESAAMYLQVHLDSQGRLPSFLHTHWLAAGLWHILEWQEPAERVHAYLLTRINDLTSSSLAWMIITMRMVGFLANHPLIEQSITFLENGQQPDGHWLSEDGPSHDIHATLEALRALQLCGRG